MQADFDGEMHLCVARVHMHMNIHNDLRASQSVFQGVCLSC